MEKIVYKGLDYDDVIAIPRVSSINHLSEVNLYSNLRGKRTGKSFLPIFSSPMKGISGVELVQACHECDILGILHRFDDLDARIYDIHTLYDSNVDFGVSIGIRNPEEELKVAFEAYDFGATLICIDIANGYISDLVPYIKKLRDNMNIPIMAGNVATGDGYKFLNDAGADYIRVGIGSGNLCLTRDFVGIGVPQLTALDSCSTFSNSKTAKIISDGGISNSARALKSFIYGADFVMIGSLFGSAIEAENKDDKIRGMASRQHQIDSYGYVRSVEGREEDIAEKRPLKEIVYEFTEGLRSGCAYLNCNDYRKLQDVNELIHTGKGTLK